VVGFTAGYAVGLLNRSVDAAGGIWVGVGVTQRQ
jgi:hypothetical protein